MNPSRYVLRAHYFGYNDEYFYISGSHIQQVFTDEAEAHAAWKKLEIQAAREYPLHELQSFFDGDKVFLQEMDEFVFSRCGAHILDEHGWPIQDALPEALSDDDTFAFIQRAHINSYQLISLAPDDHFYTIWLPQQQAHLMEHDECVSCLVYAASPDQLKSHLDSIMYQFDANPYVIKGTLAELSDSPTLLQAAIKDQKHLKYNDKKQQLEIHDYDGAALHAINELLKAPLFEYQAKTLEEIMALEQELVQNHYWDEDDE